MQYSRALIPIIIFAIISSIPMTAFAYSRNVIEVAGEGPSGIAVDPGTGTIYVSNFESDNISVIDGDDEITIDVEGQPLGLALGDGVLYVANSRDDSISVIDLKTNEVVDTLVDVGEGPYALAYASGRLIVTNEISDTVTIIGNKTETIGLPGASPTGIAVNPATSTAYVSGSLTNEVYAINLSNNRVVANITVGAFPLGVAFNPETNTVYVANQDSDTVSVISNNAVVANVTVGSFPAEIAIDAETNRIYVTNEDSGNVSVIDGSTNKVISTIKVGESPRGLAFDSAGTLYVASALSNAIYVISELNETEPGAKPINISATHEGKSFTITGESEGVQASSFTIDPFKSVSINVSGEGHAELVLPTGLIDGITNVTAVSGASSQNVEFVQVLSTAQASTIAFDVPEGTSSVMITGAKVVPEFPVLILVFILPIIAVIAISRSGKWPGFKQ